MPTIFSHPAPVLALAAGLGSRIISGRLAAAAVVASILPDLDTIAFHLSMSRGALMAHRGFSHSLTVAFALGCVAAFFAPSLRAKRLTAFLLVSFAALSHGLLDAMTTGNFGVAFFWPFDGARYSLPWHPVQISPITAKGFFSPRGLAVILSELRWIWLPCAAFALACIAVRRMADRPDKPLSMADRRAVCPARAGKYAGRCPCPYTGKGIRPAGCAHLKEEQA